MQRNSLTIKMAGTALSRVVEMHRRLSECVVSVDDEDVVPIADVLNFFGGAGRHCKLHYGVGRRHSDPFTIGGEPAN
jgi:hypothetical protein